MKEPTTNGYKNYKKNIETYLEHNIMIKPTDISGIHPTISGKPPLKEKIRIRLLTIIRIICLKIFGDY